MRAVVRLKKDTDVKKVLDILFKETDMQISYGINMVAIADGRPQLMGILDILSYYINYQRDVIYRRTKYELDIAKERGFVEAGDLSVLTAGIPSPHVGGFDYGVSNMMRIVTVD